MARNFQGTISANGDTDLDTDAGEYGVLVAGTWGSGTLEATLVSKQGGTEFDVFGSGTTLTADGQFTLKIPFGMKLRLGLTGATAPSLAYAVGEVP